jgi:hypothetical protein
VYHTTKDGKGEGGIIFCLWGASGAWMGWLDRIVRSNLCRLTSKTVEINCLRGADRIELVAGCECFSEKSASSSEIREIARLKLLGVKVSAKNPPALLKFAKRLTLSY